MRCIVICSALALAAGANAQIVGGSNLINNNDLNTLEGWLGEGPLQITNIFDHSGNDGKDSVAFHTAADGMGRTFSIFRDANTGDIYGGYNPQSWNNYETWHFTPNDSDKTAFLFNLTTGKKYAQILDGANGIGQYQTYNSSSYGPTFGGGHDIYTPQDLTGGYSYAYSYGNNVINDGGQGTFVSVNTSDLEVFTIGVPAPGAGALLGMGGLIACRRRRN